MQENNFANSKHQKSLTKNIFGQLAKLNNFIINQETNESKSEDNVLEFDKNDALITRSESEARIIVIFIIIAVINQVLLTVLTIVTNESMKTELNLVDVEIHTPSQLPHLQIILINGSVFSSKFQKRYTFSTSQYQFDLPLTADYYFSFDFRGRMSFIYGNSNRIHFFQTFRNIHGKRREKKHKIPGIHAEEESSTTGFNCSVLQIGSYLMLFGGGKDRGTKRKAFDVIINSCNMLKNYFHR